MRFRRKWLRVMDPTNGDGGTGGSGGTGEGGTPPGTPPAGTPPGGEGGGEGGDGGKPKPSDAEAKLLREVMEKKAALKDTQDKLKQASDRLKSLEGIDVTQYQALLADKAERERKEAEARGEYDRILKQVNEQHTTQLTTLKTDLESKLVEKDGTLQKMRNQIVELTIGRNFGDSQFVREQLTLTPSKARTVYGSHFELADDGTVVAYDKPAGSAERTPIVGADGKALPFDEALRKLIEADPDRDHLIRVPTKPGAGSKSEGGSGKPGEPAVGTGRERIAAAIAKGAIKLPNVK